MLSCRNLCVVVAEIVSLKESVATTDMQKCELDVEIVRDSEPPKEFAVIAELLRYGGDV